MGGLIEIRFKGVRMKKWCSLPFPSYLADYILVPAEILFCLGFSLRPKARAPPQRKRDVCVLLAEQVTGPTDAPCPHCLSLMPKAGPNSRVLGKLN